MPVYTPHVLSGSSNGLPIGIGQNTSPGTTLHTVTTASGAVEDIFIDAYNTATADNPLTIELGSTATAFHLTVSLPAQGGPYRVVAGLRMNGATGVVIRGFSSAGTAVLVAGGVNRSQ